MKLFVVVVALYLAADWASAAPNDLNPFMDDVIDTVINLDQQTCDCKYGCKPHIVVFPETDRNKSSVIQPVTGVRANVALIVDWGTCSHDREGYVWSINWGDESYSSGYYDHLLQVQSLHQYEVSGCYRITARYCSTYKTSSEPNTRDRCDYYSRVIDVTFDPPTV